MKTREKEWDEDQVGKKEQTLPSIRQNRLVISSSRAPFDTDALRTGRGVRRISITAPMRRGYLLSVTYQEEEEEENDAAEKEAAVERRGLTRILCSLCYIVITRKENTDSCNQI